RQNTRPGDVHPSYAGIPKRPSVPSQSIPEGGVTTKMHEAPDYAKSFDPPPVKGRELVEIAETNEFESVKKNRSQFPNPSPLKYDLSQVAGSKPNSIGSNPNYIQGRDELEVKMIVKAAAVGIDSI